MYKGCHNLVWCLIFITGCHQPNTELLLPLCYSVFLDPPSTHLAAQPAQGQGLLPAGLVSLRAHCCCPLQQQGKGWGSRAELPLLAALWTLAKPAGKLHSLRYLCLCKDEVLIISAWDALSVSPLENVLLCWEVLLLLVFMCESKLILLADLSVPHATLCLLLVLSLMRNSIICSVSSTSCLSVLFCFFFSFVLSFHLLLLFLLPAVSQWFSSYCSHGRITGPSASRYRIGAITLPK